MRRLGHSPKDIEAIVLSHGHFDHTTGNGRAHAHARPAEPAGVPAPRSLEQAPPRPSRARAVRVPTPSKSAIQGAGFEIIEEKQPSFLLDRSLLITGEVDRTTDFEKGFPIHQAKRNGDWQPDPLILDDQAAILHVRDKGLVVLTGCGHAGHREHPSLRSQAHRRRARVRGNRRLPPQRAAVRANHPRCLRRARGARPAGHRSGTLHGVEGGSRPGRSVPERFHPEQRRHAL